MQERSALGFWRVFSLCFGFLGIQFAFGLQNANVSRIFQTLGASVEDLPLLWLAAPLTGLIVQPLIGHLGDRTWGRLGRRRPYLLWGAVLTTAALFIMPHSPTLWFAALMLWLLDASINISMEPFRALVGDVLPDRQRSFGYAMQSLFIGVGAVVASALPWLLSEWGGVSSVAAAGEVPDAVRWSFYLGAGVLLVTVLWTVSTTREYPPEQVQVFAAHEPPLPPGCSSAQLWRRALPWTVAGVAGSVAVWVSGLEQQLHIVSGGATAFGLLQGWVALQRGRHGGAAQADDGMLGSIIDDLYRMPRAMRQLAVVQCLTWFGLFAMWIYTTPAVTRHLYGTTDAASAAYNEGANWVGILFAAYSGFAAVTALLLPLLARWLGRRGTHLLCLLLGGLGLAGIAVVDDPRWLLLNMAGVGIAWASILSLPYAILSASLPSSKIGVYMGIFNFFIVIPQIIAASVLGVMVRVLFDGDPMPALVTGGLGLVLAGLFSLRVDDPHRTA
ncbi:MAG: hypothetical protein RL026_1190 [Pseudomonadota bacterium]